jgi:hypothetical protein
MRATSLYRLLSLLTIVILYLTPASTCAQGAFEISDDDTKFRINRYDELGGASADFITASNDRLWRTGWWYRRSQDASEKQFPAPDSQTVNGSVATLNWENVNSDGFSAELTITVIDGTTSGSGTVQHEMTLSSPSSGVSQINIFNYVDIDIKENSPASDSATLITPSDPSQSPYIQVINDDTTVNYHGFSHTNYEVTVNAILLNSLDDSTPTTLSNTGTPFGPGDLTAGYEWSLTLSPGTPRSVLTATSVNRLPDIPNGIDLKMTVAECIPDAFEDDGCKEFCPESDSILVVPGQGTGAVTGGTNVKVCYEVTNTGYKTLNLHDLVDDQLGTILSDFPFPLQVGSRVFVTQKLKVTDDIELNGTWTASNTGPVDIASSMASAKVRIDSDGDGIADEEDLCPTDAGKLAAGQCGCGLADTDSDGDGTADCNDVCPNDSGKTSAGICGCGIAETDSDNDGINDCKDMCPNDSNKTTPGICGCGASDVDVNGNGTVECSRELGTVNQEGLCVEGATDCVHEQLASSACVGVNGFLNQVNIASVVNLLPANLNVLVEYFDLAGSRKGSVRNTIAANLKFDYIINDLGLEADTVGTVCVTTSGAEGSWTGGVAIYKPDERINPANQQVFGDGFDFALYYPFQNLRTGSTTVPLNTFHLGTDPAATVANWIAISDGLRDGAPLRGSLFYYNDQGSEIGRDAVDIPDGGRRDFAGHTGLTGTTNGDAIGMAVFVPTALPNGKPAPYLLTLTRYFYDCPGSSCNNFLTAFNIPNRPGTEESIIGGVSTINSEISVVELNNNTRSLANTDVDVYAVSGQSLGSSDVEVPGRGTRHVIVNRVGSTGYLAENTSGAATVRALSGFVSALSIFYKLDQFGGLQYAYAVPLVGSPGQLQISQFNSFIGHQNTPELYNSGSSSATVDINYIDVSGNNVFGKTVNIPSRGTVRIENVPLPANTFGTINVQSNKLGIVFRNYVSRPGQYTLSFGAQ